MQLLLSVSEIIRTVDTHRDTIDEHQSFTSARDAFGHLRSSFHALIGERV